MIPAHNDGPGVNLIRNVETSFTLSEPRVPQGGYTMLPDMSYTWRVRTTGKITFAAKSDLAWGPWSETRTFRTPPASSAAISPVSPTNGAAVRDAGPTSLTWTNGDPSVFYYEIQVSGDARFYSDSATASSFVWWNLVHGGASDPVNSWRTPALEAGKTYYWRVLPRVQGDGAPVAWSPIWSFRTETGTPNP